ncbi:MAG TPA: hypothetical protein VJM49_17350, partial [Acidimicrobiales bacterium]|nr:hypothetical protein [Acidimicrobiales bacterium]
LPGVLAGVVRTGDPCAGELFVQGRVGHDGTARRFDDVHGVGWRLVTVDPAGHGTLAPEAAAWFADIGGAVVTVTPDADLDGAYSAWFATHGVVAALQRPDFHLFGAATAAGDVDALVDDLRRALPASSGLPDPDADRAAGTRPTLPATTRGAP